MDGSGSGSGAGVSGTGSGSGAEDLRPQEKTVASASMSAAAAKRALSVCFITTKIQKSLAVWNILRTFAALRKMRRNV
jgi:hypothetical protein